MLFPDRLRAAREKRGVGQRELARILGISSNQMNRYENGLNNPTATILIRLAEELGVSVDYLLGRGDDPSGYHEDTLRPDERKLLEAYTVGDGSVVLMLTYERMKKLGKMPVLEES